MVTFPNAVFVGPLKTGTTWIHDYLREVPSVALPAGAKETFYFDRHYDRGPQSYAGFFPPAACAGRPVRAEVSPSYASKRFAFEHIRADVPDARIFISVREPVARTLSHYFHNRRYGYFDKPLRDYLTPDNSLIVRSDYPAILRDAVEIFGADQVHLLRFEEIRDDPHLFCARICAALGVEVVPPSDEVIRRKSNERRQARSETLNRLAARGVDGLKSMGLHAIPGAARKLGLRRLLERAPREGEQGVEDADRDRIRALLGFDYDDFLKESARFIPSAEKQEA